MSFLFKHSNLKKLTSVLLNHQQRYAGVPLYSKDDSKLLNSHDLDLIISKSKFLCLQHLLKNKNGLSLSNENLLKMSNVC